MEFVFSTERDKNPVSLAIFVRPTILIYNGYTHHNLGSQ